VHKSLRQRLKSARKDEIRSAFDLALIIIDECSRVFFNRTKRSDRQPNLVDIFTDTISGVVSQYISFPSHKILEKTNKFLETGV
jgi:hypothetical protein